MFNKIIEIEDFKLKDNLVNINKIITSISQLKNIKERYIIEIENHNHSTDLKDYIKDKIDVNIMLIEINNINNQIKNYNEKLQFYENKSVKINTGIEKYKHLLKVEDVRKNQEREELENEEINDFVSIYYYNKLDS